MRCYCCDRELSTQESTRRFKLSKEYTDMCNTCLATIEEVETLDSDRVDEEDFEDNYEDPFSER